MRNIRDLTAGFISMLFLTVCLISPAQAAMVSPIKATPNTILNMDKAKVADFLQRKDVQQAVKNSGMELQQVISGVESMTPAEIDLIAKNIDSIPAGGDALAIIFITFIVLLITDIAGYTDIFPFVVKK
ncbi:MAG: hypothetical protein D6B27_03520 [Gammaproteobacteria bacterium]|nr:MAG: hypothetical protein D6B27_03520 [Gammaproteobacteria bacterium]